MKRGCGSRDRGGVTVEFGAILPLIVVIVLLCFQALIASTTVERVENAARTGARAASKAQSSVACVPAARSAMPDWVNGTPVIIPGGSPFGGTEVSCQVIARIPLLWPGIQIHMTVNRKVTMPVG